MVEKQALEGVLNPVCAKWGISFTSNKGYSSASALYDTAKRLARKMDQGKNVVVLYLGDHDPSGIDMTRDLRDRLSLFARKTVDVKRLALNISQVRFLNLPPNPAKMTDSRAANYTAKFGRDSWELDAMAPRELAAVITASVKKRLNMEQWKKDGLREEKAILLIERAVRDVDLEFFGPAKQQEVADEVGQEPPEIVDSSSNDNLEPED